MIERPSLNSEFLASNLSQSKICMACLGSVSILISILTNLAFIKVFIGHRLVVTVVSGALYQPHAAKTFRWTDPYRGWKGPRELTPKA